MHTPYSASSSALAGSSCCKVRIEDAGVILWPAVASSDQHLHSYAPPQNPDQDEFAEIILVDAKPKALTDLINTLMASPAISPAAVLVLGDKQEAFTHEVMSLNHELQQIVTAQGRRTRMHVPLRLVDHRFPYVPIRGRPGSLARYPR